MLIYRGKAIPYAAAWLKPVVKHCCKLKIKIKTA